MSTVGSPPAVGTTATRPKEGTTVVCSASTAMRVPSGENDGCDNDVVSSPVSGRSAPSPSTSTRCSASTIVRSASGTSRTVVTASVRPSGDQAGTPTS